MKKTLFIMLALAIVLAALMAGCANNNQQQSPTPAAESPGVTPPGEAGDLKTGLGMVISVEKSANAADGNDTLAQADVIMAAVTLDAQGTIAGVKIDSTQTRLNFNAQGQLTTDIAAEQKTKVELGDAYGMARVSGIGKEWYEQIAALEDWMTGKTVDEVMALQTNAQGAPEEADLTSSVTMGVPDYLKAVQKAAANAKDFGTVTTGETKTGLGTVISLAKSKGAAADEEGVAQTDNVAAAVTIDENGVISGVMIDTAQVIIHVNQEGAVTTDLATEQRTKVEQGDAYGMAQVSGIGKEWYEQIAALGQWMIGKTIDQVTQMQLDAEGKPAETDIVSSVTIRVGDYIKAVQKAFANAG